MRIIPIIIVMCFSVCVLYSQSNSLRVQAMGNVSLALPDTETEIWSNPAKMAKLSSSSIYFIPELMHDTHDETYVSGSLPGALSGSGTNITSSSSGIEAGLLLPSESFSFGGMFSFSSSHAEKDYNNLNGSSTQATGSNEESIPANVFRLQAALNFGSFSIGAAWYHNHQKDVYSSTNFSPAGNSSNETTSTYNTAGGILGLFFDLGDKSELSASISHTSSDYESQPTRSVSAGVTQSIVNPNVITYTAGSTTLAGNFRTPLGDHLLMGIGIETDFGNEEDREKTTWPAPYGYSDQKTETSSPTQFKIGGGLTFMPDAPYLLSIEYWRSRIRTDYQDFSLNTETGDYTPIILMNTISMGAEAAVADGWFVRIGAKFIWESADIDETNKVYSEEYKMTGSTNIAIFPSAGVGLHLDGVALDYTVVFNFPSYYLYNETYNGIMLSTYPENDIQFVHELSVRVAL